jgi:hypothetical protein
MPGTSPGCPSPPPGTSQLVFEPHRGRNRDGGPNPTPARPGIHWHIIKHAPHPNCSKLVVRGSGRRGRLGGLGYAFLYDLKNLKVLDLSLNSLKGPVPAYFTLMTMTSLDLAGNKLTGTLKNVRNLIFLR